MVTLGTGLVIGPALGLPPEATQIPRGLVERRTDALQVSGTQSQSTWEVPESPEKVAAATRDLTWFYHRKMDANIHNSNNQLR